MDELLFTPAAILSLLTSIEELSDVEINLTESIDGNLQLQVGYSTYELEPDKVTKIRVSEDDLDAVSDANLDTYENLSDSGSINLYQSVDSGILKEAVKALLIGGMVKLQSKLLKS